MTVLCRGMDLSMVCFHDGFCDGKPDAMSTGRRIPGSVHPVETVENMLQFLAVYRRSGRIVYIKLQCPFGLCEIN